MDSLPAGNCSSLTYLGRIHELTSVFVASSVRHWRLERTRLISMYAALNVLMVCCFIERSLSKMKPRLRKIPQNSSSVLLREIVFGSYKIVLKEEEAEKRTALVLPSFCLSVFFHS